jgi:HemK-like putative methylase
MVKEVLNEAKMHKNITLFDIWTGSSNIAISCLLNDSNFKKAFLIDKSKKALEIAKINVKRYDLNNKIKIINGDLLNTDISIWDEEVLIITANLPYIKNWDFKNMSTETLKYEPKMALFWWKKTGFELYEKLIKQIRGKYKKFVSTKIILFIEIGFDQYEYSKKYLENLGLEYKYFKDNSWIWRCIKIFIH